MVSFVGKNFWPWEDILLFFCGGWYIIVKYSIFLVGPSHGMPPGVLDWRCDTPNLGPFVYKVSKCSTKSVNHPRSGLVCQEKLKLIFLWATKIQFLMKNHCCKILKYRWFVTSIWNHFCFWGWVTFSSLLWKWSYLLILTFVYMPFVYSYFMNNCSSVGGIVVPDRQIINGIWNYVA